jgi:hypothetical protein
MNEAVAASGPARTALSPNPLKASAALWFVVAAVGQWLFVYYVVGFYAGITHMRAVMRRCYGPPEILKLEEVEKPLRRMTNCS